MLRDSDSVSSHHELNLTDDQLRKLLEVTDLQENNDTSPPEVDLSSPVKRSIYPDKPPVPERSPKPIESKQRQSSASVLPTAEGAKVFAHFHVVVRPRGKSIKNSLVKPDTVGYFHLPVANNFWQHQEFYTKALEEGQRHYGRNFLIQAFRNLPVAIRLQVPRVVYRRAKDNISEIVVPDLDEDSFKHLPVPRPATDIKNKEPDHINYRFYIVFIVTGLEPEVISSTLITPEEAKLLNELRCIVKSTRNDSYRKLSMDKCVLNFTNEVSRRPLPLNPIPTLANRQQWRQEAQQRQQRQQAVQEHNYIPPLIPPPLLFTNAALAPYLQHLQQQPDFPDSHIPLYLRRSNFTPPTPPKRQAPQPQRPPPPPQRYPQQPQQQRYPQQQPQPQQRQGPTGKAQYQRQTRQYQYKSYPDV